MDKRVRQYATTILNLIEIRKGENIWVNGPVAAKDLLLELERQIIALGAFADMDVYFEESIFTYLHDSTVSQLEVFPPVEKYRTDMCDKYIRIWSLDSFVVDYSKIPPKNLEMSRLVSDKNSRRLDTILGIGAEFPTPHHAKKIGMEWKEYRDFFYGAVSVDLKALYDSYRWLEKILRNSKKIRIVGKDTDISMSVDGRTWVSDGGYFWNLPDGEIFTGPVEDTVEGYIGFQNKQVYRGSVSVEGLHLKFENGRISDFKASSGKKFFEETINTDKGARFLGEIGVGINPMVTKITYNDLFDEKILGTIHIALGSSYVETGARNKSSIHWDLIKDLRGEGVVLVDDRVVFENGQWIRR